MAAGKKSSTGKGPPEPGGVAAAILAGVTDPGEIRAFERARHAGEMRQYLAEQFPIMLEKLTQIARGYGLDPRDQESWFIVAFRLAMDYAPDFNPFKKSAAGAKQAWTLPLQLRLLRDVDDVLQRQRIARASHESVRQACRTVASQEPWKSRARATGPTLERQHGEAMRGLAGTIGAKLLAASATDSAMRDLLDGLVASDQQVSGETE